jgi:hypothetical protein
MSATSRSSPTTIFTWPLFSGINFVFFTGPFDVFFRGHEGVVESLRASYFAGWRGGVLIKFRAIGSNLNFRHT